MGRYQGLLVAVVIGVLAGLALDNVVIGAVVVVFGILFFAAKAQRDSS